MRSRALSIAVVGAAVLLVVGFVVLYLGADAARDGIGSYRSDHGLPPRDRPDRWTLALVGHAGGAALSALLIALMWRWSATGRRRGALVLALCGEIALGLALALDGLLGLTPSDDVTALIPAWYAPLSVAQGLGTVVVFGLVIVALPLPVRVD